MAIDLADLIEDLKTEVSAPGINQLPSATDDEFLTNLRNGFWEAVLDGAIVGYKETDGIIKPLSGTTNLSRELQQLVIFYAGYRIVRNQLRNINTRFSASAGSVKYETEQAATILKAIYDSMTAKRNYLLVILRNAGVISSYYIDSVQAREQAMADNFTYWIR